MRCACTSAAQTFVIEMYTLLLLLDLLLKFLVIRFYDICIVQVCFRDVVFPLLPRMRGGLYYNTFIVSPTHAECMLV